MFNFRDLQRLEETGIAPRSIFRVLFPLFHYFLFFSPFLSPKSLRNEQNALNIDSPFAIRILRDK